MSAAGRLLALDLGRIRIGVALSDALGITAQPLPTVAVRGRAHALDEVTALVRRHEVGRVVVGLPLLMSGDEGENARGARRFAGELEQRLDDVAVELWDERLSSAEARRRMVEDDVSRSRRRRSVDAVAAVLILQSYLDARAARPGAGA